MLNYKLTSDGFKEFQIQFPEIMNLRKIFLKLRELDENNDSWYTDRISNGKVLKTSKTAADLGAGAELEDKEVSGFQYGSKTPRMISRTK